MKKQIVRMQIKVYPPLDGSVQKQLDPNTLLQIDSSTNTKELGCNIGTFQLTNTKDTNPLDVAILPAKTGPVDETQYGYCTLKKDQNFD